MHAQTDTGKDRGGQMDNLMYQAFTLLPWQQLYTSESGGQIC